MKYISTTDLRTKASSLKDSLKEGESTYLVHRSKVIGVISPYKDRSVVATKKTLDAVRKAFSTGKSITPKELEKLKRDYLMEKYGKDIS